MELYGEEFLRKPAYTDIEKLYARHDKNHEFPGLIGIIDCTGWSWENCSIAIKAQICKGDHMPDPFILLEAISSQLLMELECVLWGFRDEQRCEPFTGYYLSDDIYPEWSVLMQSISNPESNDHKRIMYKTNHEAAKNDVE
uniref:Uncharacterized protein n=1 Tax=Tanacetum cinerariifolium TaxID=118510 RepID=A0A6L2KMZ7_TANCI|nr:hypothetical protein [Tanacetum cinerariifolium]